MTRLNKSAIVRKNETEKDKMYTVNEVAEKLRLNPAVVRRMIANRKLKHIRVGVTGRSIRVTNEQLEEYLENAKKEGVL